MTTTPATGALQEALAPATTVAKLVHRLSALRPVGRRSVFVGAAVAGSALATDPKAYALRPQSAYATVCGPANTASGGWSVFCATVNRGLNGCPPGSFTAGWWKAADSSWCGGGYRYIVDCNARCTRCTSGCSDHICDTRCWNCSCTSGPSWQCDQRRDCCNAFRYGQCNTQVACSGGVRCRVVSCVPPYRWDNCSTTSLRSDATAEHSSPYLPRWGPIQKLYRTMGEQGSYLGASTFYIKSVGDNRGQYVNYQNGRIYWTSRTGASAMSGWLVRKWESVGGLKALGYPVGPRLNGLRNGGWLQRYEAGCIVDSAGTATQPVWGWRWTTWVATGREGGTLGYPRTPIQTILAGSGSMQIFETGALVWARGTRNSVVDGTAWTAWQQVGREDGVLGSPVSDREPVTGGTRQRFQRGGLWGRGTGAMYAVHGAVRTEWEAAGGPTSTYGYPRAHTEQTGDGRLRCTFEGGTITA